MLPLQLYVKEYFEDKNYCEAVLASGEKVAFDPFVLRAVHLSDEDFQAGKGKEIKGRSCLVKSFIVKSWEMDETGYNYVIIPDENGLIWL